MHVGLNLIYLVPGETGGTEVVARALLPELTSAQGDLRFTIFVNRETAESADGFFKELAPVVTVPVRARRRAEWIRGEQQLLPSLARREGVALVHSLANTGPAWGRFRRVVTIHDLIHRVHPEAHFGLRSLGMRMLVSLAAHRSDRVIADSESTRDDIVRLLGVPVERVDVAPLGVGVAPAPDDVAERELRARHQLGERRILLTVSAKRPHKNLARLLEALALIEPTERPLVVLPGYPTPHERELRARAAGLGVASDTLFLGWLPDHELESFYALADCFVFPSLYEGFGLPVLEAMARGVPVACSDRGSLREVAGDAAKLFDPLDPASIAGAIRQLLSDRGERERLQRAGRDQVARFNWRRTARETIASYERALGRQAHSIPTSSGR